MKYLLVLAFVGCVFADTDIEAQWQKFKVDFNRVYSTGEETCRRAIFEANVAFIEAQNLLQQQGNHSHILGVNHFADRISGELPLGLGRPGMKEAKAAKEAQWQKFKAEHNKVYTRGEEKCRRAVFEENVGKINAHNARFDQGLESYSMGVNQFTDLKSNEVPTGLNN
ncbi:Protein CTLA-2-alpha [Halotydeus destructor]|nr:Protein CTLA-2-alpha [Halotydeus destructor]